ncbi:hypothetical protein [Tenacibaculum crassostreae]|uniref:hypothetical protein n=1 Tax=Tenacibaculum crassostreae TaxID=502683 RepID=UPI00389319ED
MTFKEKKIYLLQLLYRNKFQGGYSDTVKLLKDIDVAPDEAYELAISLEKKGYVKMINTKDAVFLKIIAEGIEFIEGDNFEKEIDYFSKGEKKEIIKRLDIFFSKIEEIQLGQLIIYDDLSKENEELKELLKTLKKKNWKEVLKGKLINLGLGELTNEVKQIIIDVFNDSKLLN